MKKEMMVLILAILIGVMLTQIVGAGVTNPLPTELNLFQGESGRFKFQIQTITSERDIECTPSLYQEEYPFLVEFDEESTFVPASSVKDVYGTVSVPDDAFFGEYEAKFCISCSPPEGDSGTVVGIDTCDIPIRVNIVSDRLKDNMTVAPKPMSLLMKIAISAGILILVALIWLYLWERKHHFPKLIGIHTKKKK